MKMAPKRFSGLAAVCAMAVIAGTMASNNGSARVAPTPRRTVRRDIDFLVMNMAAPIAEGPNAKIPNPKSQTPNPNALCPSLSTRASFRAPAWVLGLGIWTLGFQKRRARHDALYER